MSADAVPGRYNLVVAEEYETFEHQVPVGQFVESLEQGQTPDEVCVIRLGDAFENDQAERLSRALQDRALELTRADATIQFAVEGSIQSVRNGFDLLYQGELYRLNKVFGADLTEHREGWLIANF